MTGTCTGQGKLLWNPHKVGMTPQEVLSSAIAVTMKRFGIKDRGIIEKGRKADLVLVEGNPLKDITDTLNLRLIWRGGVQIRGEMNGDGPAILPK